MTKRLAILASGGGTTAREIIRACRNGELQGLVMPVCLIASAPGIGAIDKAMAEGLPENAIHIVPPGDRFAERLLAVCHDENVEIVGQYGWMPRTPKAFIAVHEGRMINQHPGPVDPGHPDFGGKGMYGMRVHVARLTFARWVDREDTFFTEATAQFVHEDVDQGAVIHRTQIPILPDDTPVTLQQRLLPVEHTTQIQALVKLALGEARPLERTERLVRPEEETILATCKRIAGMQYPHG